MSRSKNWYFGALFWGVPGGVALKSFGRKNCICSSTTLHKNWISMFWGLGKEERTKIRKKKKEKKKEINLIAAKSGLVGMKGYLKTFNPMKYFLPYLSRFWLKPLFTPNLQGGFRVLKPKSRDLLPRNLVQTSNSLIHNHFVLPMSLFIDFDVSLPKPGSFFRTIFGSAAFAVTKR